MAGGNPTGVLLPDLVYDPRTRTGGEFYLYYSTSPAYYFGSVGVDASLDATPRAESSCGGSAGSIPSSGVCCVRALTALKASGGSTWLGGTLPPYAPPGQAAEIDSISTLPTNPSVTGAAAGDSVDVLCLPGPASEVLICYDAGLNSEVGDENKPIPRKFNKTDHWVRQRAENKITLSDIYCCNLQGLAALKNRDCVLIGKFYPDGGAVPSEIHYYTGVRLSVPLTIPEDANESVKISASGSFRDEVVFTARPT